MNSIWRVWNQIIHDNIYLDPLILSRQVLKNYHEHVAAWRVSPCLRQPVPAHSFAMNDFSKMTFDMAIRPHFSMAAVVLFHSNGAILKAWTQKSSNTNPLIGEVEATLLAISKAFDFDPSKLILAGDSSLVIESLQMRGQPHFTPWQILSLIQSSLNLLRWFSCYSTIKLPRADNSAAHEVAAWAAALSFVGEVPRSFVLDRGMGKLNGTKPPLILSILFWFFGFSFLPCFPFPLVAAFHIYKMSFLTKKKKKKVYAFVRKMEDAENHEESEFLIPITHLSFTFPS